MSGFSADWLALREPLDLAARNRAVENVFFQALPERPIAILDLASGAGSTVAALSPHLSQPVAWQLTDFDQALLEVASSRWQGQVRSRGMDLQADLETLELDTVDAVTTSAFLDLASKAFLERLVDHVTAAGKPFLASLTYDGRSSFDPEHSMDVTLLDALNSHQTTDKGFGPALGPEAASTTIELFKARGYDVFEGKSDWQIPPTAVPFLREFLGGWLQVGKELNLPGEKLDEWWQDRSDKLETSALAMTVGHIDFAAIPRG